MFRRMAVATAMVVAGLLLLPGTAAAWFSDVEIVEQSTEATSSAKTATATCPAGKRLTGTGFEVSPPDGRVLISYVRPSASLASVSVSAREDEVGTTATWRLKAFAFCASAPAGLQLVRTDSAASSASKTVSAACPAGKQTLGVGGEVAGASGQLLMNGLGPNTGLTAATVGAFEDETGTTASWTVTAYAICATPGQPLVRRNRVSAYASSSPRSLTRPCEPGEVEVGLGGDVYGTGSQIVLQAMHPYLGGEEPGVTAAEDRTGTAGTWTPEAITICGAEIVPHQLSVFGQTTPIHTEQRDCGTGMMAIGTGATTDRGRGEVWLDTFVPASLSSTTITWNTETARPATVGLKALCAGALPGLEHVVATEAGEGPADGVRTATATCPAGKRALSGGSFSAGETEHVMLQTVIPTADLRSVRADVAETEIGFGPDWQAWTVAVCVPPPPGLQRVSRTTASDSTEYKTASATCPAGKHLVGVGALISPQRGEVALDDVTYDHQLRTATVEAVEDLTGFEASWSLTAYAVCVNR